MPSTKLPSVEALNDIKRKMAERGYGEYSEAVCQFLTGMSMLGSKDPKDRLAGKQMMEQNQGVWTQQKNRTTTYQIFLEIQKAEKRKDFYRQFKQAQENCKLNIDMAQINAAQHFVEAQSALEAPQVLESKIKADKGIEAVQRRLKEGKLNEGQVQQGLLRVMALRSLADAKRGKKSSLNVEFTEQQIQDEQERLLQSDTVKSFLVDAAKNPKAIAAAGKGHGGALEDMFKARLRNMAPGELPESEELRHFMPTARERMESLKKQAKTINARPQAPKFVQRDNRDAVILEELRQSQKEYMTPQQIADYNESRTLQTARDTASAEMLCLRNLIRTQGGGKDQRFSVGQLNKDVNTMLNNPAVREILDNKSVQQELMKGRSTALAQKVREQGEMITSPDVEKIIYGNTFSSMMSDSRYAAKNLLRAEKGKLDMNAAMETLGNYYVLCASSDMGDKSKQFQDVPRNRLLGRQVTDELFGRRIPLGEDKVRELLNSMGNGQPSEFMREMNSLHKERKRNPVFEVGRKQPQRQREAPQRQREDSQRKTQTRQRQLEDIQLSPPSQWYP